VRLAIAVAGILSIYCGYRLFCGLPYRRSRAVLWFHGLSGAIFAIFGMAILSADASSLRNEAVKVRPAHHRPAEAGSFVTPGARQHYSANWSV
jgi:hypothetical protein